MQLIREIWRLLDHGQRRAFLRLQAVALTMAVSTLIGIAGVVPFFAVLGDPQRINHSRVQSWLYQYVGFGTERGFLIALGIASLAGILLANAINWLGSLAMSRFAFRIGNYFSVKLFDDYLRRDCQFHAASNSATLLNNIVWETGRGTCGILQYYFVLCTNLAAAILIIASLVVVNPSIAAAALAGLGASYAVIYWLARQRLLRNGQLESRYTEERTRIANESLAAVKEISIVRGQGSFSNKFERSCESLSRAALNTQAIAQSPRYILECLVVGGLVVTALLLVGQGGNTGAWLAQLTYLGLAAYRLLPALHQVFHALVRIRADRVAFSRVADDLRRACQARAQPLRRSSMLSWHDRPHRDIQLTEVAFNYSPDRPAAIRDVTLRIAAGTTVGLVGPSGSGKTTLAELIVGLLVPTAGSIAVDGIALDDASRAEWLSAVAYVPQRIFLFDASLAENIALAVATEHVDEDSLRRAVRLAQLDHLVATLPGRLHERVGEHGARLSGGQRQRIGIARALYRNAPVLILDEATNALDRLTEDEIMATLEGLRGERTIILIAHRLSAALRCDVIFEIENGIIVGSCTHDELARPSAGYRSPLQGTG